MTKEFLRVLSIDLEFCWRLRVNSSPQMYDFVIIRVHFNIILASFSFLISFNIRSLGFSLLFSFIFCSAFVLVEDVLRQWILFTRRAIPSLISVYWKFMIRDGKFQVMNLFPRYLLLIFIFRAFNVLLGRPFKLYSLSLTVRVETKGKVLLMKLPFKRLN